MNWCITEILILWCAMFGYGQTIEELKISAIMLVHSDFTNFSLSQEKCITDSIVSDYNISTLEHEGILGCSFFLINAKWKPCKECSFILAYSEQERRFFRLQGFEHNEFTNFCNLVLLNIDIPGMKRKKKSKKIIKQVISQMHIDKIELKKLYTTYYQKYKNSFFDPTSCYEKFIIRIYCN